jgi:flavin-dependent dehydrogenase
MEFDVVIVGAGPVRGWRPAIRLKQVNPDLTVGASCSGKGLRSRRAHPVRRGRRSDRHRPPVARLAEKTAIPFKTQVTDDHFLDDRARRLGAPAEFHDAAADEQSWQLHRLARQCLPLARRPRRKRSASKSIPGFAATEVVYDERAR